MANEKRPDPSQQFSEWITQWERSVDEFSNKLMGTDEFAKSLNQMQSMQLEFQKKMNEMMATQLANLNMPSREEVLRINEEVANLDRRLDRIERTLRQLVDHLSDASSTEKQKPSRTKTPPRTKKKPSEAS
ncbi:MAG: hypothetical protein OXQ27_07050 [Chloroflexota bacterium]|nr:hypothetical protein [Chloroflexota bacterium]